MYVADVCALSSAVAKSPVATPRLPLSKCSLRGSSFTTGSPLCKDANLNFFSFCLFPLGVHHDMSLKENVVLFVEPKTN
jgi:hypothetical protein